MISSLLSIYDHVAGVKQPTQAGGEDRRAYEASPPGVEELSQQAPGPTIV
jgi:hypothetical protein